MDKVIEVRDLALRFHGAETRALNEVSFTVRRDEVLGVVGATGAGKSTLLKVLSGVIPFHEKEAAYKGEVRLFGREVREYASLTDVSARVGLVLQDPEVQLVNTLVREELAWGMENRGFALEKIAAQMARAAALFDIEPLLDRFTHALSGGEKQRVVVASVFCLNPEIILLDEPTSELDPAGTESVMNAIRILADEGVTVIVVEHKIEELAEYADRLLVLDGGNVAALGKPADVCIGEFQRGNPNYCPEVLAFSLQMAARHLWPAQRLAMTVAEASGIWRELNAPWGEAGGEENA
ncbi:energy-coupling factor ABC transporter ATP-binding protein [Klebsiella quasipneumoniae]|uniref:energy-coupling factor ABC transporter ATP-binding protein n=1 Tax=Klebsiella quasipneumoniae TaxID=1463165 RepID=UPI003BF0432B